MSSGNAARRLFKASCISSALPSKNRPHPGHYCQFQPQSLNIKGLLEHTSNEQSIAGKDGLVVPVLGKEADAVLSVTRRVHTLESDVAQLEGLAVARRLGHTFAVLAADDVQLGVTEFGKLGKSVNIHNLAVIVAPYQLLVTSGMIPMAVGKSAMFIWLRLRCRCSTY